MSEHVENNDYKDYGVDSSEANTIISDGIFADLIERNKQKAYKLPVQNPLYAGKLLESFYIYKAAYSGHMGIDMGGPGYAFDICASYSGTIVKKVTGQGYETGVGYGNETKISGKNRDFMFCHMESIGVNLGEFSLAGRYLGRKGSTGNSDGAHLHYEVRLIDGADGSNMHTHNGADYDIDPNDYLPEDVKHIFLSTAEKYNYIADKKELKEAYNDIVLNLI